MVCLLGQGAVLQGMHGSVPLRADAALLFDEGVAAWSLQVAEATVCWQSESARAVL